MSKKKKNKKLDKENNNPKDKEKKVESSDESEISTNDEFMLKPKEELEDSIDENDLVTLEIKEKNKVRVYKFASKEERDLWYKAYRKKRLYTPYFLVGVAFNALLYRAGLNVGEDILLGFIVGLGLPFVTMLVFSELHFKYLYEKNLNNLNNELNN